MSTPTIIPAPPRKGRKRKQIAASESPSTPLVLLSATIVSYEGSDAIVELIFDATADDPIVDIESALGTNWTATIEDFLFGGNTPLEQTTYHTVTLYMGNAGDSAGTNRISYAATPADIVTASGRTLAAFSDRALTGL